MTYKTSLFYHVSCWVVGVTCFFPNIINASNLVDGVWLHSNYVTFLLFSVGYKALVSSSSPSSLWSRSDATPSLHLPLSFNGFLLITSICKAKSNSLFLVFCVGFYCLLLQLQRNILSWKLALLPNYCKNDGLPQKKNSPFQAKEVSHSYQEF